MSSQSSSERPPSAPLEARPVYRRRFVIEVVWTQPPDQAYIDDWGATITNALAEDKCCLFEIQEQHTERLFAGGTDGR